MDDFLPPGEKAQEGRRTRPAGKTGTSAKSDKPRRPRAAAEILQQMLDGVAKLTVDARARGRARLQQPQGGPGGEERAAGGPRAGGGRPGRALLGRRFGVPAGRGERAWWSRAGGAAHGRRPGAATFADKRNLLAGKLSAKIDVTGKGTAPELIKETLNGELSGSLEDGKFLPVSLLEPVAATLMDAADKFPSLGKSIRATAERATVLTDKHLRDLKGALAFARGAAQTVKPLQAITPGGPVSVDGKIDLDGLFNMLAKLQLKPEVATALTGARCASTSHPGRPEDHRAARQANRTPR
jgi:hypothetical protein